MPFTSSSARRLTSHSAARRGPAPLGPVASSLRDLADLALPTPCAGCADPLGPVCSRCRAKLACLRRCEQDTVALAGDEYTKNLPTWCLGEYAEEIRHLVLAWKSGKRVDLASALTPLITGAGHQVGRLLAAEAGDTRASEDEPDASGRLCPPLLVVAAPSGWRRRISRTLITTDIAIAFAAGVAQGAGRPAWAVDILRQHGPSGHHKGARSRLRSAGARMSTKRELTAGNAVIIVDDVVTTGATINAARDCLESGGGAVIGAFALAATPPYSGNR